MQQVGLPSVKYSSRISGLFCNLHVIFERMPLAPDWHKTRKHSHMVLLFKETVKFFISKHLEQTVQGNRMFGLSYTGNHKINSWALALWSSFFSWADLKKGEQIAQCSGKILHCYLYWKFWASRFSSFREIGQKGGSKCLHFLT